MITFEELVTLRSRIANSVVAIEQLTHPLDAQSKKDESQMYFHSFYFKPDFNKANQETIEVTLFLRKKESDVWQLYTLEVKFNQDGNEKGAENKEAKPDYGTQVTEIDRAYKGFKTQFEAKVPDHIKDLHEYISGKHNWLKTIGKSYANSWDTLLVNTVGDIWMFMWSNSIANNAIILENDIKNNATRKLVAQEEKMEGEKKVQSKIDTTLSLTQEMLSNIVFPGYNKKDGNGKIIASTDPEVTSILLDGAFRISYK